MTPTLSLVTGSLNRPESLWRLVVSVLAHTTVPWEMIVSDASDKTTENTFGSNVTIVPEKPRLGFVAGYNRAFSLCKGKWVVWLNDDAEVQPGYDVAAVNFMESNPAVGLGVFYYAEDRLPFKVCSYRGMIYANFGIISRELGNAVGWFDSDLTMYGSDNSLTFRVLLAGRGVASIPGARVWHHVQMDQWKTENQNYRPGDSQKLHQKYSELLPEIRRVYDRFKYLSGPEVIT